MVWSMPVEGSSAPLRLGCKVAGKHGRYGDSNPPLCTRATSLQQFLRPFTFPSSRLIGEHCTVTVTLWQAIRRGGSELWSARHPISSSRMQK